MGCLRCGGCSMRVQLVTEGDTIEAERCSLCGWILDEPVLDHNHCLSVPSPPTPIWDPEGCRLKLIQR